MCENVPMDKKPQSAREHRQQATKLLYDQGLTRRQMARQVGVHESTIGDYIARLRTLGEIDLGRSSVRRGRSD